MKKNPNPIPLPQLIFLLETEDPDAAFAAALTLIAGLCQRHPQAGKAFLAQLTAHLQEINTKQEKQQTEGQP